MASIFDVVETQETTLDLKEISRVDLVFKYGFVDSGTIRPNYHLRVPMWNEKIQMNVMELFASVYLDDDYKPRVLTYRTKISEPMGKYVVETPRLIDLLTALKQMRNNDVELLISDDVLKL